MSHDNNILDLSRLAVAVKTKCPLCGVFRHPDGMKRHQRSTKCKRAVAARVVADIGQEREALQTAYERAVQQAKAEFEAKLAALAAGLKQDQRKLTKAYAAAKKHLQ